MSQCPSGSFRGTLEQFGSQFTLEVQKVHSYCDELVRVFERMEVKIKLADQTELDNLDMQL